MSLRQAVSYGVAVVSGVIASMMTARSKYSR